MPVNEPKRCPRGKIMQTCTDQPCEDFCLSWDRCAYLVPDLGYGEE